MRVPKVMSTSPEWIHWTIASFVTMPSVMAGTK